MSKRHGDWMQTFTGKVFYPLDPRPEEVDIADIAHSLAHQCRYAGHCRTFYSVADHSIRVADWLAQLSPELELAGLLHDAAEAYLVDLPRPVKRYMPDYCAAERLVALAIWTRFSVDVDPDDRAIKTADEVILATEARDLMTWPPPRSWDLAESPLPDVIAPLTCLDAERIFLERFALIAHRSTR